MQSVVATIAHALIRVFWSWDWSRNISALCLAWQPYALVVLGFAGLILVQSAFETAPLRMSLPALTAAEPLADYFRIETERIAASPLLGIESAQQWKTRRPELQRQLREMLGLDPMPERTPLNPVVTGTTEVNDVVIEKLHFQSRPGLYVTANLYRPKTQDGPLPAMLLALTVLAGVVDAVSILALDRVFVSSMTGNLVFIGIGLAGVEGFSVFSPLVSLGSFVLGVLAGAWICRRSGGHLGWAMRNVTVYKAVLALPVTVLVLVVGDVLPAGVRTLVIVLLAASMGGQLALIRYLKVPDLLTVAMLLRAHHMAVEGAFAPELARLMLQPQA